MANTDRLIDIFNEAAARPAGAERERFLAEACQNDPDLREQVLALLQSDARAGDFLENTMVSPSVHTMERLGDAIGRYKLLENIGEGGCGMVYVAEQTEPVRRRVALKVIKLGMDTRQVVARFEAERQALAMMDHPNIAKVLDAGTTELGRPYFVMELVRGIRITDYCDQNQVTTRERLDLFIKICHAIQHAHQKGIIHRDIKPSNILVTLHDGVPVPKVIDFGIAKAIEGRLSEATVYTQLHQFIGTPAYMSPEQAEMSGLDIDTRSDIYSLGVLLYELLAGSPPFDAKELMASGIDVMRKTIREKEPVRPSTRLTQELTVVAASRERAVDLSDESDGALTKRRYIRLKETISLIRGDLDWIVMRCLEKDRTRRYETANDLAADLNRHLINEPVIARPPDAAYKFRKAWRRNRLVFAVIGAVMAALLVGLCMAAWQTIRATKAERIASRNAYALEMNVAFHSLAENNLGQALDLLNRQRPNGAVDLRGFEWRYLWQLCQGDEFATFHDEGARAAAFSPDGRFLVYSGRKIIVLEAASHAPVTTLASPADTLSFAPHTDLLASGHKSGVELWDTQTWQRVRSLADAMEPSLFSPDGRWLLTGIIGGFRLWDTQTWQPAGDCHGAPLLPFNARNAIAFSPDNQFLVTVSGENEIGGFLRVWRLPGLEELAPVRFGRDRPGSVAFSADGKHLLTGLWGGQLVIHEFATRKLVQTRKEHVNWVTVVVPLPPDGKTIATAGSDRTVNLWDAATFEHLVRLRGHLRGVMSLAASPDGKTLVSGGAEGTTKLWHSDTRHASPALEGAGLVAGFIRNGRQLVAAFTNHWCVWTPETGARVDFPTPSSGTAISSGKPSGKPYDVKPDEPLGALGRTDGTVETWHLTTGDRVSGWPAHDEGIGAVAFSPDGRQLATGSIKGEVKIWDFATQREIARFGPVACHLYCVAFSPDGKTLAASGRSSNVWLWATSGQGNERKLSGQALIVASMAFSPNGRLLATPSLGGNDVRLWELPSGSNTITLSGHVGGATAVAFSPDGKTLATAGTDMKVKLWSIAARQELATLPIIAEFPTLSFSPDGRLLAVGEMTGDNRRIQILQAPLLEDIAATEAKRDRTDRPR